VSLIEEALRKQREEVEKGEKLTASPPLENPPETAPEPPEDITASRRPWAMLAGLIVLGVVGVAVVVWLLVFGLHLWQKTSAPAPTPQVVASTNSAVKAPPAAVPPKVAAPDVPATNAAPVVAAVVPPTNSVVAPPPPPVVQPPPAPVVQPPVAVTNEPVATPPKVAMPVLWPKLIVTGIIGSSRTGHSAAIVNGQMLSPGDSLEGVRIEAIEKQRVKLVYQGEVKSLSVGGSTE
jgi:hypothetical protein